MKKFMKIAILTLTVLLLTACGNKYDEDKIYTIPTAGKYVLAHFNPDKIELTARFYEADYEGAISYHEGFIKHKIDEIAFNDEYVLIKQLDMEGVKKEKDAPIYYWVVEGVAEYIHGPLTKEEFDDIVNVLELKKLEKDMRPFEELEIFN